MQPKCLLTLTVGVVAVIATGYLNTHTDEELVVIPWVIVVAATSAVVLIPALVGSFVGMGMRRAIAAA